LCVIVEAKKFGQCCEGGLEVRHTCVSVGVLSCAVSWKRCAGVRVDALRLI
jgi:hypothetical protein